MPGDTWHLDDVFLKINGVLHYLWRAVDQHGVGPTFSFRTAEMRVRQSGSSSAC
jgi:transposase-like protein